uniref:DM2 domain-containing protein n=1 Tax=Electrophorus electricus TaxID=8005 RepID=A0A4W4DW84_ELEEL
MFTKAFRVKSNTVIKGSDRRKLRADVSAAFPSLSADQLGELVPNKEELNIVKIYAHKGDAVTLYVLQKSPIFFQLEKQLYPTVYTLWRYADILPAFTTWPQVVQKLIGGADLMLPGVVVSSTGLPDVHQGDCCAISVVSNRAPVAVGTAALSSSEMISSAMKGKGVNVLHTYMDQLWAFGDKTAPPVIPVADGSVQVEGGVEGLDSGGEGKEEVMKCEGEESEGPRGFTAQCTLTLILNPFTEQMDSLLFQCFLHALKIKVKKSELPLLTSTFLRKHMAACCPKGKHLDIKKSSFKKLSKFLQCMQKEHSLVRVKELSKGVDSIVEVDWKNPEKGAVLQASEVRTIITDYVKRNDLVLESNKSYVSINPVLCDCLLEKSEYQDVELLKWEDLLSRVLSRMQACHQLLFPGQVPVVRKGQVEPIDINVASRGSNKKVSQGLHYEPDRFP